MSNKRWAVALASDDVLDLKIARAAFELGDPRVAEIEVFTGRLETSLFSDQFEKMSLAADVAEASDSMIDALNGICFIQDSARSPLRRSGVHERRADGKWDGGIAFASVQFSFGNARVVGFAQVVDKDGKVQPNPRSRQSVWLQNALNDERALDVLAYIRGTTDWFPLYKAFEAMRADGGGNSMGWPDTGNFTGSANIRRHFSGHSSAKQAADKPFAPMSLSEGAAFVRSLAAQWLNWKYP